MMMNRIGKTLRRYFIAGLLVWLPVWVIFIVVRFLFRVLDNGAQLLPPHLRPEMIFGVHIPGIGILIAFAIIFITGVLLTNVIGRWLIQSWESLLSRIPLVRTIYSAVKQVLHAIFQANGQSFKKVLLIEYPRKGIRSIAFQTSDAFQAPEQEAPHVMVFVPTTPNPTSGFLMMLPEAETITLSMNVEEALRLVISLGVVMPNNFNSAKKD